MDVRKIDVTQIFYHCQRLGHHGEALQSKRLDVFSVSKCRHTDEKVVQPGFQQMDVKKIDLNTSLAHCRRLGRHRRGTAGQVPRRVERSQVRTHREEVAQIGLHRVDAKRINLSRNGSLLPSVGPPSAKLCRASASTSLKFPIAASLMRKANRRFMVVAVKQLGSLR